MDVFYNKTVTIWNRAESDDVMGSESWFPTVLNNVRLLVSKGRNMATSGLTEADKAKLHISTKDLSKEYMEPIEWDKSDNKSEAFTLCQDRDFFTVGDTSSVVPTDDFYQYMKSNYDGVYMVGNVDTFELIPHLEVGGN